MGGFESREHSITADLARLKEARDFAELAAEDFGFDSSGTYQLKLAMSEAVTNAIQHGSSSADDQILLRAVVEDEALAFYVKDSGRFHAAAPDVNNEPPAEGGRGLEFMRRLMDDVDIQPGEDGTLLRFAKRPDPDG